MSLLAEEVPVAKYDADTKTFTFTYAENSTIDHEKVFGDIDFDNAIFTWKLEKAGCKKVVFEPSFAKARLKSTANWFNGWGEIETIEGLEYLNTSEVENMSGMFGYCTSLKEIDLSHFDTRNVTNMSFMFARCTNLKKLDLKSFHTEKVTSMSRIFTTCESLETLDISNFSFSSQPTLRQAFSYCTSLKNLIVGNNDFKVITNKDEAQMSGMFTETGSSSKPVKLIIYKDFDTSVLGARQSNGTYNWCNGTFTLEITTGINGVNATPKTSADAPRYNLNGQLVERNYNGIIIQDGKKFYTNGK